MSCEKSCEACGFKPNFEEWMKYGIEQGWCGPPCCSTHDGIPMTEAEEADFEEGDDPCVHVIRPYEDAEVKAAVESNHCPSRWRDIYTTPYKSWPPTSEEPREEDTPDWATPEDEQWAMDTFGKTLEELAIESEEGHPDLDG